MNIRNRPLAVCALTIALALTVGTVGGTAVAVPPHRHCMLTPQGYVELAPGVVEKAPHNPAFHEFHNHVHVGQPPTTIIPVFDLNEDCPD